MIGLWKQSVTLGIEHYVINCAAWLTFIKVGINPNLYLSWQKQTIPNEDCQWIASVIASHNKLYHHTHGEGWFLPICDQIKNYGGKYLMTKNSYIWIHSTAAGDVLFK